MFHCAICFPLGFNPCIPLKTAVFYYTKSLLPLFPLATQYNSTSVVGWLLKHTKLTGREVDDMGATPLHLACELGHVTLVRAFVRRFVVLTNWGGGGGKALTMTDDHDTLEFDPWSMVKKFDHGH